MSKKKYLEQLANEYADGLRLGRQDADDFRFMYAELQEQLERYTIDVSDPIECIDL